MTTLDVLGIDIAKPTCRYPDDLILEKFEREFGIKGTIDR